MEFDTSECLQTSMVTTQLCFTSYLLQEDSECDLHQRKTLIANSDFTYWSH